MPCENETRSAMPRNLFLRLLALAIPVWVLAGGPGRGTAGETMIYHDPTHGFAVTYPNSFVVRAQDVAALPRFTPMPVASILFMNPTMARGALAGHEPPDLQVRVYDAAGAASLPAWLISTRLASADAVAVAAPNAIGAIGGLKVCRQDMIAPACSVFILHRDRVYQLTAISTEGERMIDTFTLSP
jgi:hypothetical protein